MSNLTKYREMAGMTQEDLADALEKTQGCISHWETGRTAPPLKTAQDLVAVLNQKLEEKGLEHVEVSEVFPPVSSDSEAAA